jgi:hypothetical protein
MALKLAGDTILGVSYYESTGRYYRTEFDESKNGYDLRSTGNIHSMLRMVDTSNLDLNGTVERAYLQMYMPGENSSTLPKISICYQTEALSTSATLEQEYAYMERASVYKVVEIESQFGATYVIDDPDIAKYMLKNGVIIRIDGEQGYAYVYVKTIFIEYFFYKQDYAPDIRYITQDGEDGLWKYKGTPLHDKTNEAAGNTEWCQAIDKDLRIGWEYLQPYSAQKNYRVDIGIEGGEYETAAEGEAEKTITIPRSVWQKYIIQGYESFSVAVYVTAENGAVSEAKLMIVYVYTHSLKRISPENGSILKYEKESTLEWETQEEQDVITEKYLTAKISGYRIDLSENDGATFEKYAETVDGTATTYTIPEKALPVGHVIWRVYPLYDGNTVVFDTDAKRVCAEGDVLVVASPETSTVTCDGKPVPTVFWESVAQTSYQVRFGDYDSGAVNGSEQEYRVPLVFSDGIYEVSVRTQTESGEWSEWSGPAYIQIQNNAPGFALSLRAEKNGYFVRIVWSKNTNHKDYVLYRNGEPIYVMRNSQGSEAGYMDKMATGRVVYTVRGMMSDGYYDEAKSEVVDATPSTDVLFCTSTEEMLPLRYTPVYPRSYNYSVEAQVTYRYFAGRSKPVAVRSGQKTKTLPMSYIDKGRELARKLMEYAGETVVFKDSGGDRIVGILNTVNAGMGNVSTTSFQITEVDFVERVEYIP